MDYSGFDDATLRSMLDASYDLEERQHLRSVLRRRKKHSNTVCFSPNHENIANNNNNNNNNRWSIHSPVAKWEERSCRSPSPSSPFLRCNGGVVEENDHGTPHPGQNGTVDRSKLRVINGCNRSHEGGAGGNGLVRHSLQIHKENFGDPLGNFKKTLGKTFSDPVIGTNPMLSHSRVLIQQILAPKMAAATSQQTIEAPKSSASKAEEIQGSISSTSETVVRTDVENDKPVFTCPLCDVSVEPGDTAVLECRVEARYKPMVLWYRNSVPVPLAGERYQQSYDGAVARLAVKNVGSDVLGVYECTARNAVGKVTSDCRLSLWGDSQKCETPKRQELRATVCRSETLPASAMALRLRNSTPRRVRQMEPVKSQQPLDQPDGSALAVSRPEEVEEEAVARSTRTETASDGGKVTTTTTVTTRKTKDGSRLLTKQTKQMTRVGGVGTTNCSINKCSAEEIAERLAGIFEKKALNGTSGIILVKTENWNSQDGITHRNEKSQIWEAPHLAVTFSDADLAENLNYSEEIGHSTPLHRNASTVKQRLLDWCRYTLKDYKHVNIGNFSTSWNDGMAFCALVHHFIPDAFDYDQLDPKNRRENFQLAFDTAEKRAGIVPLLDVDDMVRLTVPDWKCVFMYVQSIYREFKIPKQEKPAATVTHAED